MFAVLFNVPHETQYYDIRLLSWGSSEYKVGYIHVQRTLEVIHCP